MVKNNIISAAKANRLYWLGRYEERVYLTLHLLRKCYDKMIDGTPEDYETFWQKLDICNNYLTTDTFTQGMMFDEDNPASIISALLRAQDNAILLREDITSETLSYIEMAVALMRRTKNEKDVNITMLQPVTDWALAFWGSAQQRVHNLKALVLMFVGRRVENIDMHIRFGYPFERIMTCFSLLMKYLNDYPDFYDEHIMKNIQNMMTPERYDNGGEEYRAELLKYLNQIILV